jgi:hypothetical protein
MSKTVMRLCAEYEDDVHELIKCLRKICVDTLKPRRMRRYAHLKLNELCFIDRDDSCNEHLNSETDSDFSDSSVSSASSASSASSFVKEDLYEMMGLDKTSSQQDWLNYDRELRRINNEKKKKKTHAKKDAIRSYIEERKASKMALEEKELQDAITNALRNPVKNFSFLIGQVGFQQMFFEEDGEYAFVLINRFRFHEIVIFKGVSSPNEDDICKEIGESAWFHMKSRRFDLVYSEIVKFKSPEQVQIRKQAELEKQAELKKQAELEKQAEIQASQFLKSIFGEANTDDEKDNVGLTPTRVSV